MITKEEAYEDGKEFLKDMRRGMLSDHAILINARVMANTSSRYSVDELRYSFVSGAIDAMVERRETCRVTRNQISTE